MFPDWRAKQKKGDPQMQSMMGKRKRRMFRLPEGDEEGGIAEAIQATREDGRKATGRACTGGPVSFDSDPFTGRERTVICAVGGLGIYSLPTAGKCRIINVDNALFGAYGCG